MVVLCSHGPGTFECLTLHRLGDLDVSYTSEIDFREQKWSLSNREILQYDCSGPGTLLGLVQDTVYAHIRNVDEIYLDQLEK